MSLPTASRRSFLRTAGAAAGLSLIDQCFPFRAALAGQNAAISDTARKKGFDDLRAAYDLGPGVVYLNHASVGCMPRHVREAHQQYVAVCESNPWLHIWGDAWVEAHERTRRKAAALMGCQPEELAFTHNTTEGFNALAAGCDLKSDEEVLFSSLNHVGASACWRHYAETRGFSVRQFDFPVREAPGLSADDVVAIYAEQITDKTKALAIPHIDNLIGLRHPVKALAAMARKRGVRIIAVDGAQSIGMIPVNLAELDVDVYATSPHKWLQGPKSRGFLYVRKAFQARMRPLWVTWGREMWADSARKYEDYGTRDLPSVISMEDAMDFQDSLGLEARLAHCRKLWTHARERVRASKRLSWRSPADWSNGASLYSVEAAGVSSKAAFKRLFEQRGLVFRPFETQGLDAMRLSPNALNTTADLDRFFDALDEAFPT